jgi:hypothetical protein
MGRGEGGTMDQRLKFAVEPVTARYIAPEGEEVERIIEIRTNPVTFRTRRVTLSRIGEKEKGTETLPEPPPDADRKAVCPFCQPQVMTKTPQCAESLAPSGRLSAAYLSSFPIFPPTAAIPVKFETGYSSRILPKWRMSLADIKNLRVFSDLRIKLSLPAKMSRTLFSACS